MISLGSPILASNGFNRPVTNIRIIKVLHVLFRSNNKINTLGLFIKIIKKLKGIKHRRLNAKLPWTLKKNNRL